MRLPRLVLVGLFLVTIAYAQGPDETGSDDFSTSSTERKTLDTPSLPKASQEIDPNAKVMEGPSLPAEEIDLLAVPELPTNKEEMSHENGEFTTESTTSPSTTTKKPVVKSQEMEEPEKSLNEDPSGSTNPFMSAPEKPLAVVEEATIVPKSSEEESTSSKPVEPIQTTESPEKPTEESIGQKAETTQEPTTESPTTSTTSLPELKMEPKSTESKLSLESMTDPFQQGTQVGSISTATEQSKEVGEETMGMKPDDTDLKTSAEPTVPVVKVTSEEKLQETTTEPKVHTDMETAIDLKERPLVPVVHEDESSKSVDSTTTAKEEEASHKSVEMVPLPSELPIPVEPVQQTTSHQVENEDSLKMETNPVEVEETTHSPNESVTSEMENEEHKLTSAMSETVGKIEESTKSETVPEEKITKSPAERPQFEEPKQETTEKPFLNLDGEPKEKHDDKNGEPEEFGHGTEPPAMVPTAETHLMTTESSESDSKVNSDLPTPEPTPEPIPEPTPEPTKNSSESLPETTQTPTTTTSDSHAVESTPVHQMEEEGLFAGDMKNLFVNHQNETSTIASIVLPPKENEGDEPKLAEEITETSEPKMQTNEPIPQPELTSASESPLPEPTSEIPVPEPKANDNEPIPQPEFTATSESPLPEPSAEPTSIPQPEMTENGIAPTAEPEPHIHHSHSVHPQENTVTDTMKTPFSLRFTNIDFTPDFNNLNSGASRKLHDQIYDDLSRVFENTLGDNYVGFELLGFQKGSVIVNGQILSRDDLGDPSMVAAKLEDTLQKEGSRLGENTLDLKSVYVDGILSKGGAEMNGQDATAAANTGYIVGGSIAIGVLIMAFIIFAVIVFGVNARRRNKSRTLKLKEELSMAEHGRSPFGGNNGRQNGGGSGPVNLTSYGNSTPGQSSVNNPPTTTTSPMLLNSSQFSTPQGFQAST